MAVKSDPRVTSAEALADDFITVVTHVMKRSSAPMIELTERYDLNFTQLKLLFILGNADAPFQISRLAELAGSSLPACGRAVDGLVRSQLATRTEDPDDRRVKRVELTELGDQAVDLIYQGRVNTLREFLADLSPEQIDHLASAINPLREKVLSLQTDQCESRTEVSR